MRQKIKDIVLEEFTRLIGLIEADFVVMTESAVNVITERLQ